ncbi:hypothetical protein PFISCL1PPCAC_28727 [Pristionchus fissidentatus]|uniref:Ankyrin repeat-containing protein n=1 Tax=Pristionchus fissidentatus TaxID=1538716 RepID=A0AAV5X137_9BILA|nr:hypothetical protein PFISCL1PPCAC_28727 [Pristionchus fissidentatus]
MVSVISSVAVQNAHSMEEIATQSMRLGRNSCLPCIFHLLSSMFVSHRFLSEMSSITRSRVEMARDSQDLLMWEWDPREGAPTRRLYPESQESPYGISSIQIMISIKLIDCPRECGKLIEESIRLWYESIKDDNLSHFMSEMLYEDDESEPIADSTLIILAVLVTAGLICIIFAVISLIRRRKRHITGFEIPDNLPDLHMCPLDPIERIEVKEINRLEKGQDSPLHSIVASNNQSIEEDIEALLKYGESINTIDREGRSVLHVSLVYRRSSQFIRWLISKGADPSTVDDKNQSLLHFSVSNNDLDIVSILLEFPVVARMINHCDYRNMTPLKLAMIESPIEICRLLIDCGAMVDFSGIKGYDPLLCHRSPIHLAVMNDNLEQVELLLERGANINSVDDRGRTALHYAVIYRRDGDGRNID